MNAFARTSLIAAAVAAGAALTALVARADEAAIELKAAPGREAVQGYCVMCHSLDYIPGNSPFLDHKGWDAEVQKMIKAYGAKIPESEVPKIVDYLAKQYGRTS